MDSEAEQTADVYATVHGQPVTSRDLLRIATHSTRQELLQHAIQTTIIRREAETRGIFIEDHVLQEAADDFRAERDLFTSSDTVAWLRAHALTSDEWLLSLEEPLLRVRVRAAVLTEEVVLRWFAENRLRYDTVELYRIAVFSQEAARELRLQVLEEGADFFSVARRFTLESSRRPVGGYLGYVSRDVLSAQTESAIFGALQSANATWPLLVGPVSEELATLGPCWCLYAIAGFIPSSLAVPSVYARVEDDLFINWLADQQSE